MSRVMHKSALYTRPRRGGSSEVHRVHDMSSVGSRLSGGQPLVGFPWSKSVVGEPVGTSCTGAARCPRAQLCAGQAPHRRARVPQLRCYVHAHLRAHVRSPCRVGSRWIVCIEALAWGLTRLGQA